MHVRDDADRLDSVWRQLGRYTPRARSIAMCRTPGPSAAREEMEGCPGDDWGHAAEMEGSQVGCEPHLAHDDVPVRIF